MRQYETGFGNYAAFFNEPLYWHTFARTAIMSILATALTADPGFPDRLLHRQADARADQDDAVPDVPDPVLGVSELVRTFGWMILLRETGVFSQRAAISGPDERAGRDAVQRRGHHGGLVYTSMLFMVVPLVTTLDSLDDSLIEAGYDLGGNGYLDPARDRHSPRHAGDRVGLHRRLHAVAGQLPDADPAGRQGQPVVHRA